MRTVNISEISSAVKNMCIEASYLLGEDTVKLLKDGLSKEESPIGKEVLEQIIENAEIAKAEKEPLCQDTGVAVFFIELGQDVHIEGGDVVSAINKGMAEGYQEGYLRKSIVRDPLNERKNTGDNTPAIIHWDIVPGDKIKITFMAKGGGCENMSAVKMLAPADGIKGVKDFVVETVKKGGANPCPPIVVGVGVGGNFEKAALLAKKALLRHPAGSHNPDPYYAEMEKELLERINNIGIGPQGFGGRITALAVHVEYHPCHIASLPAAVNIDCHSHRHKEIII